MSLISDLIVTLKGLKPKSGKYENPETWSGEVSGETLLDKCPFVVFDTELSGLNPGKDFIVSIGALKMTGKTIKISQEFHRFIKPAGEITKKSVEVHGITPGELEHEEAIDKVLPDFLEFIRESVLVGHFVNIDINFVTRALKKMNKGKLENPAVDTHTIHEWLYENGAEFKRHYSGGSAKTDLFSIADRYGIPVDTAHDALNDAFITAQLLQRFLFFLDAEGIQKLNELQEIGRA
jgi:DNA polymerase III epsilon subunit family exonuclease